MGPLFLTVSQSHTDQYHYFSGYTDSGVAGDLLVYDQFAGDPDPSGSSWWHDLARMDLSGSDFKVFNSGRRRFNVLRSLLMRDGVHKIWSMKRVGAGPYEYSPFDIRVVNVDNGIPRLYYKTLNEYHWPYGGLTPSLEFRISDRFQVDGVSRSNSSGICKSVVSAILRQGSSRSWAVVDSTVSPTINYSISGSTSFFYVTDTDAYPQQLIPDREYEMTYEWGDNVGYKSSTTFRFIIPNPSSDTTPPVVSVDPFYTYPSPVIIRPADGTPAPVRRGIFSSFVPLQFHDDESGANFRDFKLEVCPENWWAQPLLTDGPTPGCTTIHHHRSEDTRRDPRTKWGSYFWFSNGKIFRPIGSMGTTFTDPVGTVKQIRVAVKNWKGLWTVTPENYWRVQVVAP